MLLAASHILANGAGSQQTFWEGCGGAPLGIGSYYTLLKNCFLVPFQKQHPDQGKARAGRFSASTWILVLGLFHVAAQRRRGGLCHKAVSFCALNIPCMLLHLLCPSPQSPTPAWLSLWSIEGWLPPTYYSAFPGTLPSLFPDILQAWLSWDLVTAKMAEQVSGELASCISWITPFPLLVAPKRTGDSYHSILSNFGVQLSHIHTHTLGGFIYCLFNIPFLVCLEVFNFIQYCSAPTPGGFIRSIN